MDEQRIWAPWRIGYVSGAQAPPAQLQEPTAWQPQADKSCFLCRAASTYAKPQLANQENFVVELGSEIVALLNRFPYANGHLLVAPLRHVAAIHELTDAEHLEAMHTISELTQRLSSKLKPQGFNVGLNLGRVAGAGVPGHLHWHIVPRWDGDNNFMPTIAGVRVIPQSLEAVWEALTETTS